MGKGEEDVGVSLRGCDGERRVQKFKVFTWSTWR
jgi:hypothetical protein